MALFRMTAAFGLLLAVAPEPTLDAVRQVLGVAQGTAPAQAAGEAALAYCRANPEACIEAARRAAATPSKPPKT